MRPLSDLLASAIARRPRATFLLGLLLTVALMVPATRFRVEPDITALLPEGAPGAEDYRVFLETFGGFEKVFVRVRRNGEAPEDPAALLAAAAELTELLAASPEVADARAGLTEEDERFFFRWVAPRMPLLLPGDARERLAPRLEPEAIRARVARMRQSLRGPAGAARAPLYAADPLGVAEEDLLGAASAALPIDPMTGQFLSAGRDAALVVLTPARAEIDPAGGRALLAELERARAAVERSAGFELELQAVGGPLYAAHDEELLRSDLSRTATASGIGVALLLLLGFGGGFIPLLLLGSVVAGLVWTAGITAVWLGPVSVVGVGFAAALVGMGVEYGIHGGARFRELRRRGEGAAEALRETFRNPGPGIVSTALTTAAGLAALGVAHFRPLRELGQVLALGVLVTLVTTALLGASLLVLFPKATAVRRPPPFWERVGAPALRGVVGFSAARPRLVLGATALATALALWGLGRLDVSTDLRSLRPADHPLAAAEQGLMEAFGVGLDTFTVVARGDDLGQALGRAAAAREALAGRLGGKAQITSPADWLAGGEALERRLRELSGLPLERAADDLERELAAAGFRRDPFAPALAALRALGRGEAPEAPPPAEWPRWLGELVRVDPRGAAVAVHVRVPLGEAERLPWDELAEELRAIAPGSMALASVPRVGAELRGLALSDMARSSGLAGLLVAVVVLVSVRWRAGDALLSSLPLALGCLWAFGLWGALGLRIDLLAISTLPVLFGTGIDLGVHAVVGGRLRAGAGIRATLEEAGMAMVLVVLTTGVGFGSLGGSRVPGIQTAGTLVALGVVCCLAATFLVLPALESLFQRRHPRGYNAVSKDTP
jgi:uncharacterized protein